MTIIKCINFGHIILAPPTILVKIRHCLWVVSILVHVYKWIKCVYHTHTTRTRGYPLPAKKLKLKFSLYFIKLNLIKINLYFIR